MSGILEKLSKIQQEIKVPKNQYNSFGGYNYRSLEDILEAVKPLLKRENLSLLIFDTIEDVGGLPYVSATTRVSDNETGNFSYHVTAQAFIQLGKKKQDYAQATGAASSYARKYALGGLLLLDDGNDPDATNKHDETEPKKLPDLIKGSDNWEAARKFISVGGTIAQLKTRYKVSQTLEELLKLWER